jgi:hypothetical protein
MFGEASGLLRSLAEGIEGKFNGRIDRAAALDQAHARLAKLHGAAPRGGSP